MATPLFSKDLISPSVVSELPNGYTLRPLQKSDHEEFLSVLTVLTKVGDISFETWSARYDWMAARNDEYFVVVIENDLGKVVAVGSLIIEKKFIRNCAAVGHIEDIAVAADQQGKKLGLRIIHALDAIAQQVGCYKSILDCSEKNQGFYEKCGFKLAGVQMSHYYEGK
ncbi:acyl-CoA N-acyltransferase [Tuber brumale]|nr:acyl-CoA N-acyltransferase [Tuber brumale]